MTAMAAEMAPYDLVAIAAHPDDAELGCGGALVQAAAAGARVAVIDLTRGERASRGIPALRQAEREAASAILGLAGRFDLHLPDTAVVALPGQRERLAALLRRLRPCSSLLLCCAKAQPRRPCHTMQSKMVLATRQELISKAR